MPAPDLWAHKGAFSISRPGNIVSVNQPANPRLSDARPGAGAHVGRKTGDDAITPDANGIVYVKQGGTGNGSSWATATGDFQGAVNAAGAEQVWVATGTYQPEQGSLSP